MRGNTRILACPCCGEPGKPSRGAGKGNGRMLRGTAPGFCDKLADVEA